MDITQTGNDSIVVTMNRAEGEELISFAHRSTLWGLLREFLRPAQVGLYIDTSASTMEQVRRNRGLKPGYRNVVDRAINSYPDADIWSFDASGFTKLDGGSIVLRGGWTPDPNYVMEHAKKHGYKTIILIADGPMGI